jgi:hypothetical protein
MPAQDRGASQGTRAAGTVRRSPTPGSRRVERSGACPFGSGRHGIPSTPALPFAGVIHQGLNSPPRGELCSSTTGRTDAWRSDGGACWARRPARSGYHNDWAEVGSGSSPSPTRRLAESEGGSILIPYPRTELRLRCCEGPPWKRGGPFFSLEPFPWERSLFQDPLRRGCSAHAHVRLFEAAGLPDLDLGRRPLAPLLEYQSANLPSSRALGPSRALLRMEERRAGHVARRVRMSSQDPGNGLRVWRRTQPSAPPPHPEHP